MKISEVVGGPVIAYHGTTDDISQFRPLTHFGTEKAARDRMDYKKNANGKIYKVQLDIRNPFTIKDFPGIHYDRVYAFELRDKKKLSQEDMAAITTLDDPAQLRAALLAKVKELGYDGFVYKNRYEDKGNISYVILDPSQVKVLEIIPLGEEVTEDNDVDYEEQIEDFVQSLNPDDVGVEQIGPYHVHFEGFTDDCQDDANRRCNLPANNPRHLASYDDVYKEVIKDFVRREGGKKPLKVGFTGDEDYPIIYAVFDNPEPYKNPDAWNPNSTVENFADGKKPGRKGLAKRVGVDCSKSETQLRRIAKNSSGEKQRMAHWCANMKGGRK
jgi:hypothetical protein